ncbi:MAG: hypothetical protein RI897_2410 [Verrucomicrobiota bacterium]
MSLCWWLQFDRFAEVREGGLDAVALLDEAGEGLSGAIFAVGEGDTGFGWGDAVEPVEEVGLACVGAEPAERVDFGADSDGLAVDFDFGCAFDEESAEGAVALVADDEDVGFRAPEVLFEVVEDTAAGAHA